MTAPVLGPDGAGHRLVTAGDRVASFGPHAAHGAPSSGRPRDPEGRIEPGRVNAHTHVYSGLAPLGLPPLQPPPRSFPEILERLWWRLDRALDEDSLRASARFYVAEALLAGTTTLIDHHESPNLIEGSLEILADACQELGIRALLGYGATERNGGRREAERGLAECRRFLAANDRPLVRGAVALHASFTVSDETILEAAELCRDTGAVLHVHLAEDEVDLRDARRRGDEGPLERLIRLDALPAGSILAHCVHCSAAEIRQIAERKVWIVQNPRSNRGNGVGYPAALGESDRVAVGTDGYPARMDDEEEALLAEALAHGETAAQVERRLAAGHRLAAELFGAPFAPLAPGGVADAVVWSGDVARQVVVGGRLAVDDGMLVGGDLEEIRAEAGQQAGRLWRRMDSL